MYGVGGNPLVPWGSLTAFTALLFVPLFAIPPTGTTAQLSLREVIPPIRYFTPPANGSYYAKWTNGPPSTSDYFPIGVWLQDPNRMENGINNATNFKNIGVNVFVGLYNWPPDTGQLATLKSAGIPVIAGGYAGSTSEIATILSNPNAKSVEGYQMYDEPDMPNTSAGCLSPSSLKTMANADMSADPTRPVHINFGKGVAIPGWFVGGANCSSNTDQQATLYLQSCDICSVDYYAITDPYELPHCAPDCLWRYGATVDRVRALTSYKKPVWNFIETEDCCSSSAPRRATPAQVKSAVWLSIIHGAMGIEYFCHQFYDPNTGASAFIEDACLVDATMAANIKAIDAQIAQLAPVLNSPWISNGVQVVSTNSAVPIDTMVKRYSGSTYLFAIGGRAGTASGTFSVAGVGNTTAQVVGEGRSIPVVNGRFSDSFSADYQVHIYQIPGSASVRVATSRRAF
jgi:hypothetical protein